MQDMAAQNVFGFAHLWESGDSVSHFVAILLALMSVASWYLILVKLFEGWKLRRAKNTVQHFWSANTLEEGIERLNQGGEGNPYALLAAQGHASHRDCAAASGLSARFDAAGQVERALQQQLSAAQASMESGLTMLATTGATAPFVGLFGTVCGIYHALVAIGMSGQAALERVAGPVGEALIMTAAGLAVALPAVFAYNAFTRINRVALIDLDAFAHDLYTFFTLGSTLTKEEGRSTHHARTMAEGV